VIALELPLIGPAASVLGAARELARGRSALAILCEGDPGVGKSHLLDLLALELTRSPFAIERINGQSLGIEVVREWRERAAYGNLFSDWTVKRVDELDLASSSATAELLTYLDYLTPRHAVLATTNDYAKLRANSKGRLETRFVRFHVGPPSVDEAIAFLRRYKHLPAGIAKVVALGSVPEGCLPTEGVNMRACLRDADGYFAARASTGKAVAA
jgi:ATPase family associated with various cellular activities (AAA)